MSPILKTSNWDSAWVGVSSVAVTKETGKIVVRGTRHSSSDRLEFVLHTGEAELSKGPVKQAVLQNCVVFSFSLAL